MLRFAATGNNVPRLAPGSSILQVVRPDREVEQEGEVVPIDGASLFALDRVTAVRRFLHPLSPTEDGCDSTDVDKKERRRRAGGTPTRRETLEVDALLADLDRAREMFASAERRARTYLVRRGVIDQTSRDLTSLLRECVSAQDADPAPRGVRGRS
jgi:hypothetical protein